MKVARVNTKGCPVTCVACFNACKTEALEIEEIEDDGVITKMSVWANRCDGCCDCVGVCPHRAIKMVDREGKSRKSRLTEDGFAGYQAGKRSGRIR